MFKYIRHLASVIRLHREKEDYRLIETFLSVQLNSLKAIAEIETRLARESEEQAQAGVEQTQAELKNAVARQIEAIVRLSDAVANLKKGGGSMIVIEAEMEALLRNITKELPVESVIDTKKPPLPPT